MSIEDIIHDTEIYCGALFPLTITLTDDNDVAINLTGYAVYCEIREKAGGTLLASPTVVITAGSGQIYISLTPAQTKSFGAGVAEMDVMLVEIADITNVRPLLRGDVRIWPQITKMEKTMTGATTTGNGVITGLSSTTSLVVGMAVSGVGIGSGAVISTIDSPTQVTVSVVSTATGSASITFSIGAL